jgi:hypothetical protein
LSGPVWLSRALAALMIAVALYHGARLARSRTRGRPSRFDVDLTHLGMGLAMATMLVAWLRPQWGAACALVFAVPTLWFTWRSMRGYVFDGVRAAARDVPHALACAAMVYMLLAVSAIGGTAANAAPGTVMGGMTMPSMSGSSGRWSVVAVLFAVLMLGIAIGNAARLRHLVGEPRARAPALARGCQVAMSSTMVYMLATML